MLIIDQKLHANENLINKLLISSYINIIIHLNYRYFHRANVKNKCLEMAESDKTLNRSNSDDNNNNINNDSSYHVIIYEKNKFSNKIYVNVDAI
jgi:hypothetical protein